MLSRKDGCAFYCTQQECACLVFCVHLYNTHTHTHTQTGSERIKTQGLRVICCPVSLHQGEDRRIERGGEDGLGWGERKRERTQKQFTNLTVSLPAPMRRSIPHTHPHTRKQTESNTNPHTNTHAHRVCVRVCVCVYLVAVGPLPHGD